MYNGNKQHKEADNGKKQKIAIQSAIWSIDSSGTSTPRGLEQWRCKECISEAQYTLHTFRMEKEDKWQQQRISNGTKWETNAPKKFFKFY